MLIGKISPSVTKTYQINAFSSQTVTAEYMANEGKFPKEIFSKISEKFKERSQQLGN